LKTINRNACVSTHHGVTKHLKGVFIMNRAIEFISRRRLVIVAVIIFISLVYILSSHKTAPESSASNASKKYYTCITVEQGDTLWDIAGRYMTEEYASTQEYIDEVISINNMNTDVIVDGTNLLVPYYEVKEYK
jgi:hypothetical protein